MEEQRPPGSRLAEIWEGTLRLSSKLKDTEGSILMFSTNRFPIDPVHLRIGLLFILEPEEERFKEFLTGADIGLPYFITDNQEIEDLCETDIDKVLTMTNDYITLFGQPPPCIDGINVKMELKDRIVSDIRRSLIRLDNAAPEVLAEIEDLEKVIKFTFGQVVISIKDLHRLEGKKLRTQRNHIQNMFGEFPSSRHPILRSMKLVRGEHLESLEEGWILVTRFRNEVLLPLLHKVERFSYLRPKLPNVEKRTQQLLNRKEIFREILAQNRRIYTSLERKNSTAEDFEKLYEMMDEDIVIEEEADIPIGEDEQVEFDVIGELNIVEGGEE